MQRTVIIPSRGFLAAPSVHRLTHSSSSAFEWDHRTLPQGEDRKYVFPWVIPADWDGNAFSLKVRSQSPGVVGDVRMFAEMVDVAAGDIRASKSPVAFDSVKTFTVPAIALTEIETTFTDTPALLAGDLVFFVINREGSHASDTAGDLYISEAYVSYESVAGGGGAGEANTASDVGGGEGLVAGKVGFDLRFKSLTAGANVSLSSTATEVEISATDTGEANTASNVGSSAEVFKQKTGVDLQFRTFHRGRGTAEVEQLANTMEIRAGLQYAVAHSASTLLTDADLLNTLLIGDTSGGAVDLTLPELTATEDFYQFSVVREGASQLRLLSPDLAYRIVYAGYVDDQTYEMNTDGDSVLMVYVHAIQTYYVIG